MGLLRGASYPLRGLAFLLRHRSLWKLALLPLLINLAVVAGVGAVLFSQLDEVHARLTSDVVLDAPGAWYQWPWYAVKWLGLRLAGLLLVVVSAALLYVLFLLLGAIVAAPFNDKLSERVELLVTGRKSPEEPFSVVGILREGGRTVLDEARKAGLFVALAIAALALNLLPGIGTLLYPVVSGTLTVFFLSLEFVDFSMSRRKLRFRAKREALMRHKRAVFGFGATMFAALAVPVTNLLILPIGAVGGTLLYLELEPAPRDDS